MAAGFRTAALIAGTATAAAGLLSAVGIKRQEGAGRTGGAGSVPACLHCGLDAAPMRAEA